MRSRSGRRSVYRTAASKPLDFSFSLPVLGLAIVFVWIAGAILCLRPVFSLATNDRSFPRLAWADNAQDIEVHPHVRLTDDGQIVVGGCIVGRLDASDGEALRSKLEDVAAQQADLFDLPRVATDTISLQIPPSAPMSAVNAIIRVAQASGVKRFDLIVETWAR
jgi:hypothetical protein